MSKIESLDELEDGDVVYLFGTPFATKSVKEDNPFIYRKHKRWNFESVADNNRNQHCLRIYAHGRTRIYKAKEFTVEDKAELILEGYGDCLNE